jgi:hypothetical protein
LDYRSKRTQISANYRPTNRDALNDVSAPVSS